jgi:hypothetical protein
VPTSEIAASVEDFSQTYSEGRDASRELSALTGVGLTPLLGMTFLGVRAYFTTPKSERDALPWHQRPGFFVTGGVVILLLWFGHRLPVINRFFKALKLYENKVSAAISLPLVSKGLALAAGKPVALALAGAASIVIPEAHASAGATQELSASMLQVGHGVAWVAAMVVGALVWLAGHTVNALVLVSPFSLVDWVLKGLKGALIGGLVVCAGISPWLGLAVSACYVVLAVAIAGWSFRLMVFGLVFTGDVALFRSRRERVGPQGIKAFSSGIEGVPVRTYGVVEVGAEGPVFLYRPWMLLRQRAVPLAGPGTLAVEKGLVSPVLLRLAPSERRTTLLRFPPRYRPHGVALAAALGGLPVWDPPVVRGFRAAKAWISEQLGRRRAPREAPPLVAGSAT